MKAARTTAGPTTRVPDIEFANLIEMLKRNPMTGLKKSGDSPLHSQTSDLDFGNLIAEIQTTLTPQTVSLWEEPKRKMKKQEERFSLNVDQNGNERSLYQKKEDASLSNLIDRLQNGAVDYDPNEWNQKFERARNNRMNGGASKPATTTAATTTTTTEKPKLSPWKRRQMALARQRAAQRAQEAKLVLPKAEKTVFPQSMKFSEWTAIPDVSPMEMIETSSKDGSVSGDSVVIQSDVSDKKFSKMIKSIRNLDELRNSKKGLQTSDKEFNKMLKQIENKQKIEDTYYEDRISGEKAEKPILSAKNPAHRIMHDSRISDEDFDSLISNINTSGN